jgi:hypothetical protein
MVPSTTARKIGSRIGGKIRQSDGIAGAMVAVGGWEPVSGVIAALWFSAAVMTSG